MSNASIRKHTVVIVGAGTGGTTVAAQLRRQEPGLDIAVIDPSSNHDYQPAWTLVGGGAYKAEDTRRSLHDCLPDGVRHIAQRVTSLLPDERQVELDDGSRVAYDYLVVAAGIQINWNAIDGLADALGKNGVTSNYRYDL
ncbi:MAG: FAD-dependent oxidoreductase, partial [Burkholderiales bacterium]|nr:FAD-dependent oxidoreductase [Burkholderiales bacterium]